MTDEEIFDSLGVPEDRRVELANWLHAWSRANIPGPNMYAISAFVFWNVLKNRTPFDIPEDVFDPSEWLGTIRGTPWITGVDS